jgi:hypothetical protein
MTERLNAVTAAALAALVLLAAAPSAHADESAAAVSLFDEGNRLYAAGDFAAACPKYEASLRLDASSVDTRGRLALCYEKTGRLASAWTAWREVRSRAGRTAGRERAVEIAGSHIGELEPRLARLTLHPVGGDVPPGLIVTVDGAAFPLESFDIGVAVDQGNHRVAASAPGYEPFAGELAIKDGEKKTLEVGPFKKLPEPPPESRPTPPVSTGPVETSRPPAPIIRREASSGVRKWIGIGTLGLGVVALGVAGFEGLDAMGKHDDAVKAGCSDDLSDCDDSDSLDTANNAYSAANLATGFAIAGGALALTGIILWASAPDDTVVIEHTAWRVTPSVGAGQAGVVLSGAF